MKDEAFRITEFEKREEADFFGTFVYSSAEDLLLSKLVWIQELQSAIQKDDIKNLAAIATLDKTYMDFWIDKLNLNTFGLLIMTNTPDHIKQLQLNIWLCKSPMERLFQFLQDNEVLFLFWKRNNSFLTDSFAKPQKN